MAVWAIGDLQGCFGVTQRLLLEGLLCDEDDNVTKTIELDTPQQLRRKAGRPASPTGLAP